MVSWNLPEPAPIIGHDDFQALVTLPKAESDLGRPAVPHGIINRLLGDTKEMKDHHRILDVDRWIAV